MFLGTKQKRSVARLREVPFQRAPGDNEGLPCPAVSVTVKGIPRAPQLCLLDTGALHNRFGAWVAQAAGIEHQMRRSNGSRLGDSQRARGGQSFV